MPTIYDKFIQLVSIGSMADLKNIKGKNTFWTKIAFFYS